jgi:hypothetical protein
MTSQDWSWFQKPMPHGWLVFGVFLLFLGGIYTCMGKSYVRFQGWVYRSEKPKEYWRSVATYYLGGILFVGADVFNVPADFLISVTFIGVFVYIVYLVIRWAIRRQR